VVECEEEQSRKLRTRGKQIDRARQAAALPAIVQQQGNEAMWKPVAYLLAMGSLMGAVAAAAYSIPEDQLDSKKVFWGSAKSFETPGEVAYENIVRATPEYKKLKQDKIERGTGEYWILLSQASDRAVKSISEVGENTEYDLIAAVGYLGSLEPSIEAPDITSKVIEKMAKDTQEGSGN
jgi:hypothetical protein